MTTLASRRQESGSGNFPAVATVFATAAIMPPSIETADREVRVAVAAYYIAERRGFLPEDALADWLAAERQIDSVRHANIDRD